MNREQIKECGTQLAEFHEEFAPLFYEKRQSACARKMLHGLLLDDVRATAAQIGRSVPGADLRGIQHFVGLSSWNHRPIIEKHQEVVARHIGHPEGVLVCDESGFPKKGNKSVGVARQWCGRLGKRENCQVGVFVAYVSDKGHALVDEDLYLPREWADDTNRRREAGVPEEVEFRTKPQIALERILQAHRGPLPFRWVTCDDLYGHSGEFRDGLDRAGLLFVAEVPCDTRVWTNRPRLRPPGGGQRGRPRTTWNLHPDAADPTRVDKIAQEAEEWTHIQAREGAKRPIRSAWAALRVYPWRDGLPGPERWLLIEHRHDGEKKYYLSNAGPDASLRQMVQVAKREWFVEQCFRECKSEIGLDELEVRKWRGWHHHMTMCMLAHGFVTIFRNRIKKGATS